MRGSCLGSWPTRLSNAAATQFKCQVALANRVHLRDTHVHLTDTYLYILQLHDKQSHTLDKRYGATA